MQPAVALTIRSSGAARQTTLHKRRNGAAWTGKFYGSEGLAFPGELS